MGSSRVRSCATDAAPVAAKWRLRHRRRINLDRKISGTRRPRETKRTRVRSTATRKNARHQPGKVLGRASTKGGVTSYSGNRAGTTSPTYTGEASFVAPHAAGKVGVRPSLDEYQSRVALTVRQDATAPGVPAVRPFATLNLSSTGRIDRVESKGRHPATTSSRPKQLH